MMARVNRDAAEAIRSAHLWFENNSGWAPPDGETLAEWVADGICRCPDDCLVAPRGWCEHGLASWWLILSVLQQDEDQPGLRPDAMAVPHARRLDPSDPDRAAVLDAHDAAMAAGEPGYADPRSGLYVMTARYLATRASCCDQGCRHCPYLAE